MVVRQFKRWASRSAFTIASAVGAVALIGVIGYAIYDVVSSSRESDQQAKKAALDAQLADFALATRDKDGSSLLENPDEFSRIQRTLGFVSLKRSFYSYFLNRGNAKQFDVEKVIFDWPRPCVVTFRNMATAGPGAPVLEACFAVVPGDTSGRYLYFAIRFPTPPIRRHVSGTPIAEADYVTLKFSGPRQTAFVLTYETPKLALERYPSFISRYDGTHEISAFYANRVDRSLKQINAQAFERPSDANGRNSVTLVGRIDAALIDGQAVDAASWPSAWVKSLGIGVDVYQWDEAAGKSIKRYNIEPERQGTALMSIEQAYLLSVPSRAKLEIRDDQAAGSVLKWSSDQLSNLPQVDGSGSPPRDREGQAAWLTRLIDRQTKIVRASRPIELVGSRNTYEAVLTSGPPPLPDFALRTMLWFFVALILSAVLLALGFFALLRLRKVTAVTYGLIVNRAPHGWSAPPRHGHGEMAALSRVLDVLVRRNVTRSAARDRHIQLQQMQVALERELLKQRKAILDALGHEIRSPLHSLLTQTKDNPEMRSRLERMRRAVEGLYNATSVETGLLSGMAQTRPVDLAKFLNEFLSNLNEARTDYVYFGVAQGVFAEVDDIALETVLDHLFNNALAFRYAGTLVQVRLGLVDNYVQIDVFNQGPLIEEDRLESIFSFGVSSRASSTNQGQGLFVAKWQLLAMKASIHAENRTDGVAMVIRFPKAIAAA